MLAAETACHPETKRARGDNEAGGAHMGQAGVFCGIWGCPQDWEASVEAARAHLGLRMPVGPKGAHGVLGTVPAGSGVPSGCGECPEDSFRVYDTCGCPQGPGGFLEGPGVRVGTCHLEVAVHHKAAVHVLQAQDDLSCVKSHLCFREDAVLGQVIM